MQVFRIKVVNLGRRAAVDHRVEAQRVTSIGARAYRLRIDSNVRELWSAGPDSFMRLQIFARHEVTGMGKMFERRYHHPGSEIVTGSFVHGQDMTVTREPAQTRRRSEAQRESS
ncbi:hypothetical protein [Amycolatopsis kentuckyensis]|uniref:hypothetical protein n=1 Tax=Amycolatopsis kentuckyensis TaxID=218823 RepID=UPI000A374098|nr:hypothetical protein [Amycolatopsis kentuckyensis]